MGFMVEPQNQGRVSWLSHKTKVDGFSQFSLKTSGYGSCGLASKPLARIFRIGPQNWQLRFGDLGLKITMTVSWFGPQNQADFGLLVVPQNQWREVGVGHASRSSRLLHVKASLAWVSMSGLKTVRGAMTNGAHGIIAEVASS
jgi:hypothetical protein